MTNSISTTNPPEKQCAKCKEYFPATLEFFYKNLQCKQGLGSWCKCCSAMYRDKYRANNKDKIAKGQAKYRAKNKEKCAKATAKYHAENKEKEAKYQAKYYAENKEKIAEGNAKYRADNKEKISQYVANNKDKISKGQAKYRADNKERIANCQAKYQSDNKDKLTKYHAKYNAENQEKRAEGNAKYRADNKDKIAKTKAIYRAENKNKIAKGNAKYRADNKDKIAKVKAKYSAGNKDKIAKSRAKAFMSPANYKTFAPQLSGIEKARQSKDIEGAIEVTCAYCGKWFLPTNSQVSARIAAINKTGGLRFYCSEGCKFACPVYNQKKYPKGFKKATSRESNPILRQLVLKRDNYTCQQCGATIGDKVQLHCHHVLPATQNPMTANDPDNCTTYCKKCHIEVHKTPGCKNHELKCEK